MNCTPTIEKYLEPLREEIKGYDFYAIYSGCFLEYMLFIKEKTESEYKEIHTNVGGCLELCNYIRDYVTKEYEDKIENTEDYYNEMIQ